MESKKRLPSGSGSLGRRVSGSFKDARGSGFQCLWRVTVRVYGLGQCNSGLIHYTMT